MQRLSQKSLVTMNYYFVSIITCLWAINGDFMVSEAKHLRRQRSLERQLEKEILTNTVTYLRGQLIECLKTSRGGRVKRKISYLDEWTLEDEINHDILHNTKSYLTERLLTCRRSLLDSELSLENLNYLSKGEDQDKIAPLTKHHSQIPYIKTTTAPYQAPESKETQYFDHHDMYDRMIDTGSSRRENVILKGNDVNLDKDEIKWKSFTTVESFKEDTNVLKPHMFTIGKREVSCQSVELLHHNKTLRCRDLRVDNKMRLPNMDLCPEHYHPNKWRDVSDMHSRVFKVTDLRGFCDEIGHITRVWGYAHIIKVSWDCDEEANERIKWLDGDWAGTVLDNGYLRDLQCTFTAPIIELDIP